MRAFTLRRLTHSIRDTPRGRSLPFHSGHACRRSQRTWWLHLVFIETVCTRCNFYRFPHNAKGLHFQLAPYTRSRFYIIRAYAIFDLVVQTRFRVNRRARSYLYRCKKVKLRCKLSDTKKVSSYMISHIDKPFPKYTSIIQKYWYFFKSSF